MIDKRPSVLFDAVVLLPAVGAVNNLLQESSVRAFVADAFAHCKFIGYVKSVMRLFESSGVATKDFDKRCIPRKREGRRSVESLPSYRFGDEDPTSS
jgi:catalase